MVHVNRWLSKVDCENMLEILKQKGADATGLFRCVANGIIIYMKFPEDRIRFVCDWLVKNKPDKDCDFYKMWISVEILRVLVDNEWTNQVIFPKNHSTTSVVIREAIKFLKTDTNGLQFQERISRLAIRLYDIQDIAGLQRIVDFLKNGNIALSYAEIEAGSFFFRRGIQYEFVIPSGIKGKDFDIRLTEYGVNCEVKHKIEDTNPSKKTLEKTLSAAKKQVPHDEPAMFFIKIPVEWIKYSYLKRVIERTKGTFFPRSLNVLGFILHWEEPDDNREGIFFWKYRYEVNSFCTYKNERLTGLILGEIELRDTIVRLMNKYIKKCNNYPKDHGVLRK